MDNFSLDIVDGGLGWKIRLRMIMMREKGTAVYTSAKMRDRAIGPATVVATTQLSVDRTTALAELATLDPVEVVLLDVAPLVVPVFWVLVDDVEVVPVPEELFKLSARCQKQCTFSLKTYLVPVLGLVVEALPLLVLAGVVDDVFGLELDDELVVVVPLDEDEDDKHDLSLESFTLTVLIKS